MQNNNDKFNYVTGLLLRHHHGRLHPQRSAASRAFVAGESDLQVRQDAAVHGQVG